MVSSFHDFSGLVVVALLHSSWMTVLSSICALLINPNPENPLVPDIAHLFKTDRQAHDAKASEFTRKSVLLIEIKSLTFSSWISRYAM